MQIFFPLPIRPKNAGAVFRLASLLLLALTQTAKSAEPNRPTEYQIKAAFLYNFAKYVEWPPKVFAAADSPIVVGILGKDPFGAGFEKIGIRQVGSHPLLVRQIQKPGDIAGCHMLFVGNLEQRRLEKMRGDLHAACILTIYDEAENFEKTGGVINLVKSSDNKIRFQINVDAARQSELKIDSTLLNLAKIVHDPSPG